MATVAQGSPQRTCVGCRLRVAKSELTKLVLVDSVVKLDPTGAASGRGAHVHLTTKCVQQAIDRKALQRAFRRPVDTQFLTDWLTKQTVREERDQDENPMSTK